MTIRLWDIATQQCVNTVKGHSDWVKSVAVNTSGSLIASSSKDQSIMIWSMEKIKTKTSDPVVTVLQGHDNLVDIVVFANFDACKVIDKADYNKDYAAIASELVAEAESPSKAEESAASEEESKGAIKEENMTKLEKIAAMKEKMKIKR